MNFCHFDHSLLFTHTVVTDKFSDYVTNSMLVLGGALLDQSEGGFSG